MRKIFITHRLTKFERIFGSTGAKGFIYSFLVDNIYFSYPYDHLTELDFVFLFETRGNGCNSDAIIYGTKNEKDNLLISEATVFVVTNTNDYL